MNQAVVRSAMAIGAPCRQMSSGFKHQLTSLGPEVLKRPPPKMPKGYERIVKKREIFQADNGVPTYLKGGPADAILFRTTAFFVITGTLYMLTRIPEMIRK